MPPWVKLWFNVIISSAALLVFVVLYAQELKRAWKQPQAANDPIGDARAYVAVAVAGLVAAVVATALSIQIEQVQKASALAGHFGGFTDHASLFGSGVIGTDAAEGMRIGIGIAYIGCYTMIGFAAFYTWLNRPVNDLIKTQALTFLGVILASVKAFLTFSK